MTSMPPEKGEARRVYAVIVPELELFCVGAAKGEVVIVEVGAAGLIRRARLQARRLGDSSLPVEHRDRPARLSWASPPARCRRACRTGLDGVRSGDSRGLDPTFTTMLRNCSGVVRRPSVSTGSSKTWPRAAAVGRPCQAAAPCSGSESR